MNILFSRALTSRLACRRSSLSLAAGLWGLAMGGVLLSSTSALASPSYPSVLQEIAVMECTPKCTVCHTTNPGTSGTASQPFALSLRKVGLSGGSNEAALRESYAALGEEVDSDLDGKTDKLELGSSPTADPSEAGVGEPCVAPLAYGCGAHVAPSNPGTNHWTWSLLFALLSLGVLSRRIGRHRG